LSETEFNRDLTRFFFRQTIRVRPSESLDQRALAVVNVTSRRDYELSVGHAWL
jgi:hypothetical protein